MINVPDVEMALGIQVLVSCAQLRSTEIRVKGSASVSLLRLSHESLNSEICDYKWQLEENYLLGCVKVIIEGKMSRIQKMWYNVLFLGHYWWKT